MRILDLFAGIGGFSLAGHWAGNETIAFVEKDPFCQQVLKKNFAGVPIYGDIKEFDGTKYSGTVDIICGGFPCQPFSVAGKRKGTDDDRHLWPQMLRVIRQVKPAWVIGENVGSFLTIDGGLVFEQTCLDLEAEGYEVQAFIIPAVAVNAPHRRDRVWIVANSTTARERRTEREKENEEYVISFADTDSERARAEFREISGKDEEVSQWNQDAEFSHTDKFPPSHSDIMRPQEQGDREQADRAGQSDEVIADSTVQGWERIGDKNEGRLRQFNGDGDYEGWNWNSDWIEVATALCRVDDGLPVRMDGFELSKSGHRRERLKSLGNSIVPQVAYEIFKAINKAT